MKEGTGNGEQGTGWGRLVLALVVAVAMATGVVRAATIDVTQANFEQNRTLMGGNTYRFVEDVTFTAPAGESALKVEEGRTVTLEIPGVFVTLKGGDATGATGAGAGIEVPSNAKFIIKGSGRLTAAGGNAANGENGLR